MSARLNQIRAWAAAELKYWEQAALEKIADRRVLGTGDIQELVQYFIEDAGLAAVPSNRPHLSFPENTIPAAAPAPRRLVRIFNLNNVNALPEGQEIRFGPQLTLIYGNNGVGKSGYARALGSAGFARGVRQVLPNASGPMHQDEPRADIEISCGDEKEVFTWVHRQHSQKLRGFYLFDGGSLIAHLTGSNSLSFSPGALSLLTELADLTDQVRDQIRALIEARDTEHNFHLFFEGESAVKNLITKLDVQTDVEQLARLSELTAEDKATIDNLERHVAELKLLNVAKQIEKRRQEIRDLDNLINAIQKAQTALGDSAVAETSALTSEVRARREEAESSGVNQFRFERFTQVGSEVWREFVASAKALANAEGRRGEPYPAPGDHCLLCRQPLHAVELNVIQRLWDFLASDAQSRLQAAEAGSTAKIQELERTNLSYFATESNARRLLEDDLQIMIPVVDAQIEACIVRRDEMLQCLRSNEARVPSPLINIDLTDLNRLLGLRREEIAQLEKSNTGQRLATAEQSLRDLKHRQILGQRLPEIRSYMRQKKWAIKARGSLGSTRIITTKYNELFKELVTERYRTLFEATIKRFKEGMKVTIETRGFKGETVRQLVLNPEVFREGFSVDQILSDGEKRAVAMADFLTEVALDQYSNGIIFDDPVTSLDDNWKNTFARCLVEQAKIHQVIIFTHDLSFLYRINEHAEELSVDRLTHWIRDEEGHPGFVYLNNSPVCEKDYKSAQKANEYYSLAKDSPPVQQQALLQQGFGALRTSYEALIIFELFNEVVTRFGERISFGRLNEVRIEPNVIAEIINRMECLSGYIDAHLHSDAYGSIKPTPVTLFEEIKAFESIRQRQRQLKKDGVIPSAGRTF
jgi:hypothetical protein